MHPPPERAHTVRARTAGAQREVDVGRRVRWLMTLGQHAEKTLVPLDGPDEVTHVDSDVGQARSVHPGHCKRQMCAFQCRAEEQVLADDARATLRRSPSGGADAPIGSAESQLLRRRCRRAVSSTGSARSLDPDQHVFTQMIPYH